MNISISCIFCGVKKKYALSDSCYKDRAKKYLMPEQQCGMDELQKHVWIERVEPPKDFYGESIISILDGGMPGR
jgi:hypothetical protein